MPTPRTGYLIARRGATPSPSGYISVRPPLSSFSPCEHLSLTRGASSWTAGADNLNKIKAQSPLAINRESVFLAAYRPIVSDIAGNNMSVNTVTDYLALRVSDYQPDVTRPQLSAFTVDLNAGILYLDFTETVNVRMINVSHLCLQKQRNLTLGQAAW